MKAQLTFLVALLVLTSASDLLKKCCPSGKFVNLDSFSCVETENPQKLDLQNLLVNRVLVDDHNESWPACDDFETQFLIVENSSEVTQNSCVDLTENFQTVTFFCENNETSSSSSQKALQFNPVNRCCPAGSKYNYESRTCVILESDNSASALINHLPKCGTDPLVEYYSKTHKIQLRQGLLYINDRLVDGAFCIEFTTSGDLIAKVCEQIDICSRIPCIRKCCHERQFFDTTPDDKPKCEDYDYDLMKIPFHNFSMGDDLLADTPLRMELSGKLIRNRKLHEFLFPGQARRTRKNIKYAEQ